MLSTRLDGYNVLDVKKMETSAPRGGIEPTSLAFHVNRLTISPPRFLDVTTLPTPSCLCDSLPKRSTQIYYTNLTLISFILVWLGWDSNLWPPTQKARSAVLPIRPLVYADDWEGKCNFMTNWPNFRIAFVLAGMTHTARHCAHHTLDSLSGGWTSRHPCSWLVSEPSHLSSGQCQLTTFPSLLGNTELHAFLHADAIYFFPPTLPSISARAGARRSCRPIK